MKKEKVMEMSQGHTKSIVASKYQLSVRSFIQKPARMSNALTTTPQLRACGPGHGHGRAPATSLYDQYQDTKP